MSETETSAPEPNQSPNEPDKTPPERPPAAEDHDPAAVPGQPTDGEVIQQVNNIFNAPVNTHNGHFGIAPDDSVLQPKTGRLDEPEIREAQKNFVPPDGFDHALDGLATDHAVVLDGRRGTGKRTGAICLLREVTSGPLFELSPISSLKYLAHRTYNAGNGYVVIDRKDAEQEADTDFNWHTVRDQVRDAKAWLVVTSPSAEAHTSGSVTRVMWQQPDLRRLLTAWLGTSCDIRSIEQGLPDEYTMTDLVNVLRDIASGADVESALKEFDLASLSEVRRWFDEDGERTRRQILEVTAMSFLRGCKERTFESLLAQLADRLAVAMPVPATEDEGPRQPTDDVLPQRRYAMAGEGSLIGRRTVPGNATRQVLGFRVDAYGRHVLAELWGRMEVAFWDAVRDWLHGIVATGHVSVTTGYGASIARGLVELAAVAFDEVRDSFLEPWSTDGAWTGRTAAAYVLWAMCYDEAQAPVALRTAVRWAAFGNQQQRWTAALAFSGTLGIAYPGEAANRLWHLLAQSGSEHEAGMCSALATLFARLVGNSSDASIVPVVLAERWRRFGPLGPGQRMRSLTISATAEVLCAHDPRTMRSAVFHYLHQRPDRIGEVAELWSAVLCHRPLRRRLLEALLDGLRDLDQISPKAEAEARALGEALATALPVDEQRPLTHDLTVRHALRRRADGKTTTKNAAEQGPVDSLVHVLLAPLAGARQTRETA